MFVVAEDTGYPLPKGSFQIHGTDGVRGPELLMLLPTSLRYKLHQPLVQLHQPFRGGGVPYNLAAYINYFCAPAFVPGP